MIAPPVKVGDDLQWDLRGLVLMHDVDLRRFNTLFNSCFPVIQVFSILSRSYCFGLLEAAASCLDHAVKLTYEIILLDLIMGSFFLYIWGLKLRSDFIDIRNAARKGLGLRCPLPFRREARIEYAAGIGILFFCMFYVTIHKRSAPSNDFEPYEGIATMYWQVAIFFFAYEALLAAVNAVAGVPRPGLH